MMTATMIHVQKCLIVLAGLPLTGKSTIGLRLSKISDAQFFDIDVTRHTIVPGQSWLGPERERQIMREAYVQNHDKAAEVLKAGRAVILAATYSRESYHRALNKLAKDNRAPVEFFLLQTSEDIVKSRLSKRMELNDPWSNITNMESYSEVRDRYLQYDGHLTLIDAYGHVEEVLEQIVNTLKEHKRIDK